MQNDVELQAIRGEAGERGYYLPTEVTKLVRSAGKVPSTFYRTVNRGDIKKIGDGYSFNDVEAFLNGTLKTHKNRRHSKTEAKRTPGKRSVLTLSAPEMVVELAASEEDFFQLYTLESTKIGYIHAIAPAFLNAWATKNKVLSWFAHPANDKTDVIAMLTILPVSDRIIERLLTGDISFGQIPASEVQEYHPNEHYNAIIVSAATKPGQEESILRVMRQVFIDWGRRSILVNSLYALADPQETSPMMYIMSYCGFFPFTRAASGPWVLDIFDRGIQLASFIRDYRSLVLNEKRKLKNMILLGTDQRANIDALRAFFEMEKNEVHNRRRDFTEIVLKHFQIQENGQIIRTDIDQSKQRDVRFRPVHSHDDLLAAFSVNASLFGASSRFTLDELVEHRRALIEKNEDIYRVLEIDGRIVGYVFVLPPSEKILDPLLREEIFPRQISLENLQVYQSGQTYDLFLHTLGIHKSIQGVEKRLAGMYLLAGTYKLFVDLAKRGIKIRALYARSHELDGVDAAAALDMDEIKLPEVDDALVLKLDFADETKVALRSYREALAEYEKTTAQ